MAKRVGAEAREVEQPAASWAPPSDTLLHSPQVPGDCDQGGVQLQLSP